MNKSELKSDIEIYLNQYLDNDQLDDNIVYSLELSGIARCSNCSITDFLEEQESPTFQEALFKIIDDKKLVDSDVYKKANIDRRLFSKIRSDKFYTPKKNTVIQLIFGLMLTLDEALELMSLAGYTLSCSNKFDLIVRYFLDNNNYNIFELNEMLYEFNLKTLTL